MKGIESLVLQRVCTSCFGAAIALGGLLGCDQEVPQAVETTASQTATAEQSHVTWRTYAGSPDSSSYSALDQINRSNVHQLEVAWTYPTNDKMVYMANPIVIDRVMYLFAKNGAIVAVDAASGNEIWTHEPPEGGSPGRGFTYWESEDGSDRRLFMTWIDHLYAIDARTGETITSFGNNGRIDLKEHLDRDPETITRIQSRTPGRIFENLIILGSATGEDYMSPPGDIRAYDVRTGELVWKFHTIPRPGEFGYETWPKDAWRYAGGANAWGDLTVDVENGIVFIPTGSPTYDFYGADRPGDNLFGNCLLALDARTGERIWHFQTVHHDLLDYDNVAAPQLLTVTIDGEERKIVAMAGKTGFLYVLDRFTGEPIWPIEERPVPQSDVPGEQSSPTQPIPVKPPPFARLEFTVEDLNPYLPEDMRTKYAEIIKNARNEGLFTPPAVGEYSINMPGHSGGAALFAPASDPTTGETYVVSFDGPALLRLEETVEATYENDWHGPWVSAWYSCESVCEPEDFEATSTAADGYPDAEAYEQAVEQGRGVYEETCQACHGADLAGTGTIPSLAGVTKRLSETMIRSILRNGKGQMPPMPGLSEEETDSLLAYLESAGVKQQRIVNATRGIPYPEDAEVPGVGKRFYSHWGFAPALIGPPWSTLTAYDLNTGTIKWQVPFGEAVGVPPEGNNFGILQFHGPKASPAVTAGGLLIAATMDRKIRAWDKETGEVIWSEELPDRAAGIPAVYLIDGRQYVTISVRGSYIAYALPRDLIAASGSRGSF